MMMKIPAVTNVTSSLQRVLVLLFSWKKREILCLICLASAREVRWEVRALSGDLADSKSVYSKTASALQRNGRGFLSLRRGRKILVTLVPKVQPLVHKFS